MSIASRRRVLQGGLFGAACACAALAPRFAFAADAPSPTGKYVCPPCGCSADGKEFDAPGECPACGMTLMAKPADAPKTPAPSQPKARDEPPGASLVSATAKRTPGGEIGWGTRTRT